MACDIIPCSRLIDKEFCLLRIGFQTAIFPNRYKAVPDSFPSILITVSKESNTVIGNVFCTFQCHHNTVVCLFLLRFLKNGNFPGMFLLSIRNELFSCFYKFLLFFLCLPRYIGGFRLRCQKTVRFYQGSDTLCHFRPCQKYLC